MTQKGALELMDRVVLSVIESYSMLEEASGSPGSAARGVDAFGLRVSD